jgi:hypothetical protein
MVARALAGGIGFFYLVTGAWSFLFPAYFYSAIANFSPYNLHLFHDLGAFQIGLGVVLVIAALTGKGLVAALVGVLAGSLLHVVAHLLDMQLGGHPATDLPILVVIVVVLAYALAMELRSNGGARRS